MRTLESIIEKEIRTRIEDSDLCQEIVMEGTKEPKTYDNFIARASNITEDFIKANFDFLIQLAAISEDEEEEEEEEAPVTIYANEEDEDMLRFIESR